MDIHNEHITMQSLIQELINQQNAELSVYVKNMDSNTLLFEHNIHQKMRSASIIKLLILAACSEAFESGLVKRDQQLSVHDNDKVSFSLISDLTANSWRIDDVATLMIILSDNTATNLLIDLLGISTINNLAKKLSLNTTRLQRKMMDFESAKSGLDNYTSLNDITKLMEMIYKRELISPEESTWMYQVLAKQKDKSMLNRFLPESIEIAHKTGLNDGVQHDVGFIEINDTTYLIGVFIEGEPDEIKGFECIGQIAKHIYEEVQHVI